jgi:predicted transcriptional regulator
MNAALGPLEMRVLGLLDAHEARSVGEVRRRLAGEGHAAAYTTVMTVLVRLHEKGLVRREKEGPRYAYRVAAHTGRFKHNLLQRVQRSLFADRLAPIAALLDQDLDATELRELRRLIDTKLKEKK